MKVFLVLAALASVAFAEFHFFVNEKEIDNELTRRFDINHLVIQNGPVPATVEKFEGKNVVNDLIIAQLENLREQMLNGDPELGIPVMDPLRVESASVTLNQPMIFRADITVEDVILTGLAGFVIENIAFNILRLTFDFQLIWPAVDYQSNFHAKGRAAVIYPFEIEGVAKWRAEGFSVSGRTQLGTNDGGFLTLREFRLDIEMDSLSLSLTGISDDGPLSNIIDNIKDRLDEDWLQNALASLSDTLSESLFEDINELLGNISLGDIIG